MARNTSGFPSPSRSKSPCVVIERSPAQFSLTVERENRPSVALGDAKPVPVPRWIPAESTKSGNPSPLRSRNPESWKTS
jgi:hypothetical protein